MNITDLCYIVPSHQDCLAYINYKDENKDTGLYEGTFMELYHKVAKFEITQIHASKLKVGKSYQPVLVFRCSER